MFQRNESTLDRIVRAVAGAGLVAAAVAGFGLGSPLGILLSMVGAILVFTGVTGVCLIYKLLGIDTATQH
jgi:hypothetical protein